MYLIESPLTRKSWAASCRMTITRDYFKGLNYFRKLFPDTIPAGSGLVYGGEIEQERTDVSIVPIQRLHRLFNTP
jgi:hypothetical protein